jgi:hypothetical protein
VGAEEGIWNTEQEPKQTCITMSLKCFTLRLQYFEDDQNRKGRKDGSMQLAMMTRIINTVGVVKPQRIGQLQDLFGEWSKVVTQTLHKYQERVPK